MTAATSKPTSNGAATDARIAELERKLDELIFYHAELALRFTAAANVLAEMYAQQLQPQMRQAILAQLMAR